MSQPTESTCPLCGQALRKPSVRNALSRYTHRFICNDCGTREASLSCQPKDKPWCLYYDCTGPIMLVTEDEPGYVAYVDHAADESFAEHYVRSVNNRHGVTSQDALAIVSSSMFAPDSHVTASIREELTYG